MLNPDITNGFALRYPFIPFSQFTFYFLFETGKQEAHFLSDFLGLMDLVIRIGTSKLSLLPFVKAQLLKAKKICNSKRV